MGKNERMRRLYANHLGREERVLASVRGTVEAGRSAPWTGLLLATDRRLVFIADDAATYLPYSAIDRVERGKRLIGSYVVAAPRAATRCASSGSTRAACGRSCARCARAVREGRQRRHWWSAARSAPTR